MYPIINTPDVKITGGNKKKTKKAENTSAENKKTGI